MFDPRDFLIATDRPAMREWLLRHWPWLAGATITTRPRDFEVEDRHCIGSIAVRQAVKAWSWSVVDFDRPPRGELTADEMEDHGAHLVTYRVIEEPPLLTKED